MAITSQKTIWTLIDLIENRTISGFADKKQWCNLLRSMISILPEAIARFEQDNRCYKCDQPKINDVINHGADCPVGILKALSIF